MAEANTWKGFENLLNKEIGLAMEKAMKGLEPVLNKHIEEDWYGRPGYSANQAVTNEYIRSFQLRNSAISGITEGGKEGYLMVDYTSFKPILNWDAYYNTYMDLEFGTSYGGKSYGEWVSKWIEKGNKFLGNHFVYTKTENEIKDKNLAEKELVKALKNSGIDSEVI